MKSPKVKKVKERRVTREERIDTLKDYARSFEFVYNPTTIDLTRNPEECRKATESSCWRPDIYLDAKVGCAGCSLFEHCACGSKVTAKRPRVEKVIVDDTEDTPTVAPRAKIARKSVRKLRYK